MSSSRASCQLPGLAQVAFVWLAWSLVDDLGELLKTTKN
jgi:hypothetical protein